MKNSVDTSPSGDKDLKMRHQNQIHQPAGRHSRALAGAARACALLVVTVLLGACATTASRHDDVLVQRAQARWDAILAGDFDAAYALYSPGYRSATSRTDFELELRSHRIQWTGATYRDHTCEGKVCTVTFNIEFEAPRPVPGVRKWDGKSTIEDTWIETDGTWWYVPPER
jgi:hypothetical protein